MSEHNSATFRLSIPADDYRKFYQGSVSEVITRTLDGTTIRFPASLLREFVSHEGIHGLFQITWDSQHKLKSLRQLQRDQTLKPVQNMTGAPSACVVFQAIRLCP